MTSEHSILEAQKALSFAGNKHPEDAPAGFVVIELNGDPFHVHPGNYTGTHLKDALHVPREHVLEQVIEGEFKPVENDAHVRIRGEEVFVSHCGQGQSS